MEYVLLTTDEFLVVGVGVGVGTIYGGGRRLYTEVSHCMPKRGTIYGEGGTTHGILKDICMIYFAERL